MAISVDITQNTRLAPNIAVARYAFPSIKAGAAPREAPHPTDALHAMQQVGVISRFPRNKTIFGEGDVAVHSYRIISGAVRLCKQLPNGRRQIVDFFFPGDFFGYEGRGEYAFAAEAITEVIAASYPRARIERLCDDVPEVGDQLLAMLTRDLSATRNHVIMLCRPSAKERVAAFLISLAERAKVGERKCIPLPMGRQDIADYLGLAVETVCRALNELKRTKLIAVENIRHFIITNIGGLLAVAEGEG